MSELAIRVCCESNMEQNHLTDCPRMIAMDESYKQDKARHEDSLKNHSSEALRNHVIRENMMTLSESNGYNDAQ